MLSIIGLNKQDLLYRLWLAASASSYFEKSRMREIAFDGMLAQKVLKQARFIPVFCARELQIDISGDFLDPSEYDRIYGPEMAADIVESMR
jgi:hypothetical protein